MINFKQEYKQRVFDVLRDNTRLPLLMEYLNDNNDTSFRICLQEILDQYKDWLRPKVIVYEKDWEQWNQLSEKYLEIEALYTDLLDSLVQDTVQKEDE